MLKQLSFLDVLPEFITFKTSVQFGGQIFQFVRSPEKSQRVRKDSVVTAHFSLERGRMSWIPALLSLSLCQLDRNRQCNGKPFFSPFLQYSRLLTGGHSWIALARNIWVPISHSRTVWRVMDCNGRQLERLFPCMFPMAMGLIHLLQFVNPRMWLLKYIQLTVNSYQSHCRTASWTSLL